MEIQLLVLRTSYYDFLFIKTLHGLCKDKINKMNNLNFSSYKSKHVTSTAGPFLVPESYFEQIWCSLDDATNIISRL